MRVRISSGPPSEILPYKPTGCGRLSDKEFQLGSIPGCGTILTRCVAGAASYLTSRLRQVRFLHWVPRGWQRPHDSFARNLPRVRIPPSPPCGYGV